MTEYADALVDSERSRWENFAAEHRDYHLNTACQRLVLPDEEADIPLDIARQSGYSLSALQLIFRRGTRHNTRKVVHERATERHVA